MTFKIFPLVMVTVGLMAPMVLRVGAHGKLMLPFADRDVMDGDGKLGCPTGNHEHTTTYNAGEVIKVGYNRNNHIGGFIRWSMVKKEEEKTDERESKELFDKRAFFYTCRESGTNCTQVIGPADKMARDYGTEDHPNKMWCGDRIRLPDWLDPGEYILQWTWFGVGHHNGDAGVAENQFRACANIHLNATDTKQPEPKCPSFVGGDRMSQTLPDGGKDVCLYFHTNEIVTNQPLYESADKRSDVDYKYGIPKAVEDCRRANNLPINGSDPLDPKATSPSPPAPTTLTTSTLAAPSPSATNVLSSPTSPPSPSFSLAVQTPTPPSSASSWTKTDSVAGIRPPSAIAQRPPTPGWYEGMQRASAPANFRDGQQVQRGPWSGGFAVLTTR